MKKAKELWKMLGDPVFQTVLCDKFITNKELEFKTKEEADEFFMKFLIYECISGSNSEEDLMRAYKIIQKWVSEGRVILSENLPIGRHKTHDQKTLVNVEYFRFMNKVFARELVA